MLNRLIRFSIQNKTTVGMLTIFLIAMGIYSWKNIKIDALPDITNNQVQIITNSPSFAGEDIERLVTMPLEAALSNIPNLVESRSFSRFGLSVITLVFEDDTDIYWARQQISERLIQISNELPAGIGIPYIAPITTGLGEIYQYQIQVDEPYKAKFNNTDLRTIQDWVVKKELLTVEGVAEISSFGGFVKQFEVSVDNQKMKSLQVSMQELTDALEKNNQNIGGAYIEKKPYTFYITSEGMYNEVEEIENTLIRVQPNGTPLLVKQIAKVNISHATRYGALTSADDGEIVGGIVLMLKNQNSSNVIESVKEKVEAINRSLPKGVRVVPFLDRSILVGKAVRTVYQNLAEGALIVIFVLVLMLGNIRAGLIVASVIPLSLLFALTMMHAFGVSGNLMSLGAIDFGLVVDGSLIVVEACVLHLNSFNTKRLDPQQLKEEVYVSSSKIRNSAAFGEMIILIVYIPILTLSGIEGKMFKPMAETVIFAILGAFVLSMTYVPMMCSLWLRPNQTEFPFTERIIHFLQSIYKKSLLIVLKRGMAFVLTLVFLSTISFWILLRLGGEFLPTLEEGDFAVETRMLTGSSLSNTIETTLKVSQLLKNKFPEVEKVIGKIGSSEIPTDPMPVESCDLIIVLKDKSEWISAKDRIELAGKMQDSLEKYVIGVSFGFQQPIQMRFNELLSGARQDVAIKVFGNDYSLLNPIANQIQKLASEIEGVEDVYVENKNAQTILQIKLDRFQLARYGIDIATANDVISTAYAGKHVGFVYEGHRKFELVIRLDSSQRQNIDNIGDLPITSNSGNTIPLKYVAQLSIQEIIPQIQHENGKRKLTVGFNVRGRDVQSIIEELDEKIRNKIKLPDYYQIEYGGQFLNLQMAKERLMISVPFAILLIGLLLYFTFHQLSLTLLVFTCIPLSAIGGILALWFRGMPFSISAGIGFIALFGVSVLNGIVLISKLDESFYQSNTSLIKHIFSSCLARLRPVLMTAFVASLGFLPMAISTGSGAEVQKPLATVVIGGLLSSTFLTLFAMPLFFFCLRKSTSKVK